MPGITRAVRYALNHYGIQVEDLETLRPFVGPPLPDSFKEYYNFSDKDSHDAVYVFREYYNVTGWMENAPFDGIEDMLKTLKENGKKLYVATSKPDLMAKQVLDYFGLTDYFTFVGGASDDGSRVKKNDVIRHVMESCSLNDKEAVLMVGDRKHDIEGAHKEGIFAVGVLYGYGSFEELEGAGADKITDTVKDLKEFLLSQ
jgi:phosphoglycolate phosphatase